MNVCALFKNRKILTKRKKIVFHLKEKSKHLKCYMSVPVLGTYSEKQSV